MYQLQLHLRPSDRSQIAAPIDGHMSISHDLPDDSITPDNLTSIEIIRAVPIIHSLDMEILMDNVTQTDLLTILELRCPTTIISLDSQISRFNILVKVHNELGTQLIIKVAVDSVVEAVSTTTLLQDESR